MTRRQWLWLYIWIFIFFSIFCIWSKLESFHTPKKVEQNIIKEATRPASIPLTPAGDNDLKKDMSIRVEKVLDSVKLSGRVSSQSIKDELVDAYEKEFEDLNSDGLIVDIDTKDDNFGIELFENFVDDFSHFNSGSITYTKNSVEIDGITDNSITKGSIQKKSKLLTQKGIDVENQLQLEDNFPTQNQPSTIDLNSSADDTLDKNIKDSESNQTKKIVSIKKVQEHLDSFMKSHKIHFLYAKDILTPESKSVLDKVLEILHENNNTIVEIGGHTDSDGTKKRNLRLSTKRAEAVKRYLIDKNIDKKRLKSVGYGESRPLVKNSSEDNKQKNRRVEFKIIGELK